METIFIGTTTHICKRYCSREFLNAASRHAIERHGCLMVVANNAKESAASYYSMRNENYTYADLEFGEFSHGRNDSIHYRITNTAEYLRNVFLQRTHFEWYLSLEADVILSGSVMDAIVAEAEQKTLVLHTNCYPGFNNSALRQETGRITMGCTLIHRSVLEKIPFRYDPGLLAAHYDAFFAFDCNAAGIPMIYNPFIQPEHRQDGSARGWQELPASEKVGG